MRKADEGVLKDSERKVQDNYEKGILGFAVAMMVFGLSTISSLAATGTVTGRNSENQRESKHRQLSGGIDLKGAKIDIVGAKKDSSGTYGIRCR